MQILLLIYAIPIGFTVDLHYISFSDCVTVLIYFVKKHSLFNVNLNKNVTKLITFYMQSNDMKRVKTYFFNINVMFKQCLCNSLIPLTVTI